MFKTSCGKKQYIILLILSVFVSLLLPMIGYPFEIKYNSFLLTLSAILNIFSIAGVSILVFVSFRYKFKYCLPLALFSIILIIYNAIFLSLYNKSFLDSHFLFRIIVNDVLYCALPFASIGVAKLTAKHTKKEILAVLITLLGISVLDLIIRIIFEITVYYQDFVLLKENYIVSLKSYFPMILAILYKYILMFVIYYILKFAFSDNKKEKIAKFALNVKKLWAKTAE